jgi:uncharacterized protein (TIGR04255 family)
MPPITEPFGGPVDDVPLRDAPLVRVLAQVRFPEIASVAQADFVGPFQQKLKHRYPILRKQQEIGFLLTPGGAAPTPQSGFIWRFADMEADWQVSLAPTFLSVETKTYKGQAEFVERLSEALAALSEVGAPLIIDRFGLRYVNRLPSEDVGSLRRLLRREVLGVVSEHDFASPVELLHMITESRFELKNRGILHARWGFLPPRASIDPTLEAVAEPTWILDFDMGSQGAKEFDVGGILAMAREFHDVIYRFFRWSVTDEFLKERVGNRE